MRSRLQKWGNSLAARLPKAFAADLGVGEGSPVEMSVEEGAIVIRPDRDRAWDLEALLAEVTDENVHPVWVDGPVASDGSAGGPADLGDEGKQGRRAGGR